MEFDFSLIIHSIPLLLRGAGLTLEITALAVGLGLLMIALWFQFGDPSGGSRTSSGRPKLK